jgi:type I restriction enzyme M protein
VILANPPFSGKIQAESILADLNHGLNTRATELLFLKWFIDHLAPGGRAGVIVPSGVLFGANNAALRLREKLLTECDLQAVLTLPSGVFKPYSGVGTAVLIFQKGRATERVWFYELAADGFSLTDTRTPIEADDIPDVLTKWPGREEGSKSHSVALDQIRENDWSLIAARYKPSSVEHVTHDAPANILDDVLRIEKVILDQAQKLSETMER